MSRGIYPIAWAQMNRERAGQKYRPSNATEGDVFMEAFCNQCVREREARREGDPMYMDGSDLCDILTRTLLNFENEEDYPNEWQYGVDGQPTCTAFQFDGELPDPRCSATRDLFAEVQP